MFVSPVGEQAPIIRIALRKKLCTVNEKASSAIAVGMSLAFAPCQRALARMGFNPTLVP
jgi:hypothetical protein